MAITSFLALEQGIQLVQGPPGTGKTTMISTLLKVLIPRGKVLVCAPSNKAVHVLADKFLTENNDIPIMLTGVEDKLPKDHNRLQEIFVHGWGDLKLEQINSLKTSLWTLLPDEIFIGNEGKIRSNVKRACENIKEIQEIFLTLAHNLKKYNIPLLGKEDIEQFLNEIKEYIQFITDDTGLKSVLAFILQNKQVDVTKEVFQKSKLSIFFSKIKNALTKITQLLTKIELQLYKMNMDESSSGLEAHLLNHSHIIFATLSVCGRKSLKDLTGIETLIIDEAGQASEAETLIPLFVKPKRCLLVGDPKQLPATIISNEAVKLKFERSMMWRLIEDCGQIPIMLTTQYRMHPEIRYWPSLLYYENKLQDGLDLVKREATPIMKHAPSFLVPYAFINVCGKEANNGHSFQNQEEGNFIVKIINHFQSHYQVKPAIQIGVITFYKGQSIFLQKCLLATHPKVKVQTVDSFQGDENDIIIISFVRANSFGNIGFIKDFRRLNVALTRAKHSLILIGDANTLEKANSDVRLLINNAKERKCYFEQDFVSKQLDETGRKSTQSSTRDKFKNSSICRFYNGHPKSCRKGTQCSFSHLGTIGIEPKKQNSTTNKTQSVSNPKVANDTPKSDTPKSAVEAAKQYALRKASLNQKLQSIEEQLQCLDIGNQTLTSAIDATAPPPTLVSVNLNLSNIFTENTTIANQTTVSSINLSK